MGPGNGTCPYFEIAEIRVYEKRSLSLFLFLEVSEHGT